MKNIECFYHPDIIEYAEQHTSEENDVLKKINRNTNLKMLRPRMLSGAFQGKLLEFFSEFIKPENVLEIGSYVGYSAICLAKGLQYGGTIDTIEVDEELEDIIKENIQLAGMENKIHLHIGDAMQIIPTLNKQYDLIFLDADKRNYVNYYHLIFPFLKKGGYLLADNVLWSGKVCYEQPAGDKESRVMKEFNDLIQSDKRVENILLPIRDGLMLARKVDN
ncbi:O-methyltransferase [Bacteroidales bacterium OttesenSCG-928-C19]|nr:O-methyltransferase [Bacteroidales bacterium OttesenSCG-928-C19]